MTDHDQPPTGEILLYQTDDGHTRIECRFQDGTLWLNQAQLAELFQTSKQNIAKHLKAVFAEGELERAAVVNSWLTTGPDNKRYKVLHYGLQAILAVGYRVRSPRGTAFRQWATARLHEYLLKGFVMDDERLKNPPGPGVPDYFDELLERIRRIRASEKRMYLKLRDIFALAADYQEDAAQTQQFFQIIQNKLHWAATGNTAAELIAARADHAQPNMGLTTWKGAKVRKADVTVAKNYLHENEIAELDRIVVMYLDYADDQARRRRMLYMRDWREKLDAFLAFNERDILTDAGRVSRAVADRLALDQYDQFETHRLAAEAQADEAAFENAIKQLPAKSPRQPKKQN
jgi:hypothetical protein